jgi:hypothetical protein
MRRKRRTLETLQAASDHLYYEYWMLKSLAHALASSTSDPEWLRNAYVESWVVHFRNILDFFYPPSSVSPEDVVAVDYFDNAHDFLSLLPELPPILASGRKRANREIAHLSYKRIGITQEEKEWHFAAVTSELDQLMSSFLRKVAKTKLGPRWPSTLVSVA